MLGLFLKHSVSFFTKVSHKPEFTYSVRLAGQQALGILSPLPLQCRDDRSVPLHLAFLCNFWDQIQVKFVHKYFSD